MRTAAIVLAVLMAYGVAGLPQTAQADEWLDRYHNQKEEQRAQDREQRYEHDRQERAMEKYQQRHRENAQDQQIRSLINHYQLRRGY